MGAGQSPRHTGSRLDRYKDVRTFLDIRGKRTAAPPPHAVRIWEAQAKAKLDDRRPK